MLSGFVVVFLLILVTVGVGFFWVLVWGWWEMYKLRQDAEKKVESFLYKESRDGQIEHDLREK